jgi:hypothetical protein
MRSNCGEYRYEGAASHYFVNTYLATDNPRKTVVRRNNYVEIPVVLLPLLFMLAQRYMVHFYRP